MNKKDVLSSKEVKKDLLNFVKGGDGPKCNPKMYYADSIYVKPPDPPIKPIG